jgi:hypothetical protein
VLTLICAEFAEASSEAGTVALSVEVFTKVVASAVLFHITTEALTNPLAPPAVVAPPVTVSTIAPAPAAPLAGEREARVGEGLLTVNAVATEVTPPFETVTCAVPADVSRVAGIVALNCSAEV